ncbi:MAG: M23 family metallopeptidase [Reyranellaceae bacterium]
MNRASLTVAFAVSLVVAQAGVAGASDDRSNDEAQIAEQSMLGVADDAAPVLDWLPFAGQIAGETAAEETPGEYAAAAASDDRSNDEAQLAEQSMLGVADDATPVLEGLPFAGQIAGETATEETPRDHAAAGAREAAASEARSPVETADDRPIDEGQIAEQAVLGVADDEARFLDCLPFTRQIAREGVVGESLDKALAAAAVPASAMLEARQALATALDLERDVRPGDRFYVRYEQTFTGEGVAVGIGRVMWIELRTKAKGMVAVHRFRTRDKVERFYLANGQMATPTSMRLPLDSISISSGYGLRADPFDQPPPLAATGKPAPMGGPKRNALPPGLPPGGPSGNGATVNSATPLGASLGLAPYGNWNAAPKAPARGGALFMHEGVDLVANAGTPIFAAADGIVVGAAPNGRYGNWIRIEHGSRLATVYGHLMAFAPGIQPGESVARGDLIGFVGSTGRSTGAHVHFELQVDGKAVNPVTHPELKAAQLRGPELDRFRKQVTASLAEREREAKAASIGL